MEDREMRARAGGNGFSRFKILSDSPALDDSDPLESEAVARRLEELIVTSKDAAPFTVSIEAGWGAGKSTIMRRLERRFQGSAPDQENGPLTNARTVWFNAWTASEAQVLEGLVRSVLDELDNGILRRVARQKKLLRGFRLGGSAVAGLLGIGNIVDRIWTAASLDPKQRNELNDLVRSAMTDWRKKAETKRGRPMIVLFIDDLDRCTPATVMRVFEAMKLYLDAPGFVFVLGWDTEQVMRAVASERGSDDRLPYRYVEKIVQFGFRVPRPTDEQLAALTQAYCDDAGLTTDILSDRHRELLISTTNGNPRQLKRFLNRFILLHDFAIEGADAASLILLLVLQSSYDGFYRLLSNASGETDADNPLFEFTDYVAARQALDRRNLPELERVLKPRGYSEDWPESFVAFERDLPQEYPLLATDRQFVGLLKLMSDDDKRTLRDLARSTRLDAVEAAQPEQASAKGAYGSDAYIAPGKTVLWIDDKPKTEDHALLPAGVELIVATSQREAKRVLADRDGSVDLIISDIGRGLAQRNAGIDGLAELRRDGYVGPAVFYTMGATSGQVAEARKLKAEMTNAPGDLRAAVYRHLADPPGPEGTAWDRSMVQGRLAQRKWERIEGVDRDEARRY